MSSTQTHPRRRPFKATSPQMTPLNTHNMSLRKSGTFSSPNNISSELCGLDNRHFMPKRSPTDNLEELLNDAGVRRVANILERFDKTLAGHSSSTSDASILHDPEVLPLPSFMLHHTTLDTDPMDVDTKFASVERSPHQHTSDSGLGSSVSGSKYGDRSALRSSTRGSISTSVISTHSAITRSFSALGSTEDKHTLGEYARKQIHDHIIKPILAEDSLKDFHPLIEDVPRRIGDKNISNLRDLEKTLIFLAPEFSATPASYLRFCERSIQLLHATVECLSEQDQRLPTDRPYTNNYFLDLVEQIRRYAAIMAATRQKEANGEELDEMDYSPGEKITLRGGLSHNGRPAELVREKNGKVIPIAEASPSDETYATFSSAKRSLSEDVDDDDDGVRRSMARRRKSEKPGDVLHVCRDCKKEFKRPCDLTKHEKTHSRPWKCTEEKCKYYDLGWPTEKERDRHVNDKHSAAPPQYKCLYPPCTYASKRESNCKQHMEKAHGWEYVRSKSNGRKKATSGSERSPQTPLTPYNSTPASALATPATQFAPSPSLQQYPEFEFGGYGYTPAMSVGDFQEDYRRDSITTAGSAMTYSSSHSPPEPTSFEDAVTPEEPMINHNDVFNHNLNSAFNPPNIQQPTPALSVNFDTFDFARPFPVNTNLGNPATVPHLSPGAQADVTLFSPHMSSMQIDEGFEESLNTFHPPTADFTLFDSNSSTGAAASTSVNWFPDLTQCGGQFESFYNEQPFDDMMSFEHQQ
ncbi:hypothetical protein AOQ84DRAFT_11300 [Glonium stellatum]|uniref:C2H2-type domain-containing protein n=1 Tax=Glonium stellatum TaxID=574774 RepID=A0A8E2FDJ8_9PEZI|nr:hypothetical protein AOQ84DRAFT_11300 [Glonium stellatum]